MNAEVNRIRNLERIHHITSAQLAHFYAACNLDELLDTEDTIKILVLFSGAGFEASALLNYIQKHNRNSAKVELHLFDQNLQLLDISRERLAANGVTVTYNQTILGATPLPCNENSIDIVVAKHGLHELTPSEEAALVKEVYRVLKPGRNFVVWETYVPEDGDLDFNDIIRQKDLLVDVDHRNYNFKSKFNYITELKAAGFEIGVTDNWNNTWDTVTRFHSEFEEDQERVKKFHTYLDAVFGNDQLKQKYHYSNISNGIVGRQFTITAGIISAIKK
jgi:ubiquinone/menaquinone biosynthesis C-methylase UbiE